MQKNVGTVDATIRITLGLLGLTYGVGKMTRRPHRTPWLLMTMSAMKVAEGVTRFCPMLYSAGMNTIAEDGQSASKNQQAQSSSRNQVTAESKDPSSNFIKDQVSKVGANFVKSQIEEFTHAVAGDNQNIQPPVDFDLDEVVSSQSTQQNREQTRTLKSREGIRRTARTKQTYKQDEHSYPSYS
ncbi:YgaP family membrane protein [Brevibacillus sp. SYSU BS000544]|uniref:YgaP family membrane protein n=1 Tax=Brevibacillus sp. SYSU BS000544 TaxID=3416443 RepID=UPI003CE543A0